MTKPYALITVRERTIFMEQFATLDEAKDTMNKQYIKNNGKEKEKEGNAAIDENTAWINSNVISYDWEIFRLKAE